RGTLSSFVSSACASAPEMRTTIPKVMRLNMPHPNNCATDRSILPGDMRRALPFLVVGLPALALAEPTPTPTPTPRRVPFWPDDGPATWQKHVDGAAVLAAARALARNHRVQGSPGSRAAADWIVAQLGAAGFGDARVESLPADGKTRYAHFPSYFGWDPKEGRLEEVAPTARILADFATMPVALADYSQDAD